MPDREMIHSTADVTSALLFAFDSGLQVRMDTPQSDPRPRLLDRQELGKLSSGVFFLFRPEWVYGPLQILPISDGHNAGKFTVSPGVNTSAISVYFSGERVDRGRRRLGTGVISFDREWLELPAKVMRPTPRAVGVWFKRIAAHLLTGTFVKGGLHKYYLCRHVSGDSSASECLPPFDFIPWGSDLIRGHHGQGT